MKTEKPIPFTTPMVQAILEGRKTQTRRLVKDPEILEYWLNPDNDLAGVFNEHCVQVSKPWGLPLKSLWVKENYRARAKYDHLKPSELSPTSTIIYEADPKIEGLDVGKLRPGMFMPRWASRLTLDITSLRAERLQDISEEDAFAEGIQIPAYQDDKGIHPMIPLTGHKRIPKACTGREFYATLWEDINGKGSWDLNPWVFVIGFQPRPAGRQPIREMSTKGELQI